MEVLGDKNKKPPIIGGGSKVRFTCLSYVSSVCLGNIRPQLGF